MPSELERSMESLIMVFHRYSEKDGDGNTLSKKELKELMQTELASFLKVTQASLSFMSLTPSLCRSSHALSLSF
jgi:hypothetical protein